jgi:hypothetical protein
MHMQNNKTGERRPVPPTEEERARLRGRGFFEAEDVVNTLYGHVVTMSMETSVASGQQLRYALNARRKDAGDETKPVFMIKPEWDALSETAKDKLRVKDDRRVAVIQEQQPGYRTDEVVEVPRPAAKIESPDEVEEEPREEAGPKSKHKKGSP